MPGGSSGCRNSRLLEGKRMASSLIGNEVPRMGLWVRVPCPPLQRVDSTVLPNLVLASNDRSRVLQAKHVGYASGISCGNVV